MRFCLRTPEEFTIANFGLKLGHFETPPTKTVSPFFLENKRLFGGSKLYQVSYLSAKLKEIDFSTSAAQRSVFPESPS